MKGVRSAGPVAAALMVVATVAAGAAEPYQIPAIMSLTGQGAFVSKGEQQSLELAKKLVNESGGINGRPLEFTYQDDQTNPQVAVQLANDVLAQKPAILIGGAIVATCRAIAPLIKNGPADYCLSPGLHPDPGSYVFSSSVSTLDLATALVRYFHDRGWTRIALMFSSDATGQDAEAGLKSVLAKPENKDMTIVTTAHFNVTDVSVAAQLESVKAANPQCFIAWSTGTPIATIFRGMRDQGLDIPIGTTDGNMTYAQMKQYADFLPRQLYIAAAQWVVRDDKLLLPEVAKQHDAFYQAYDAVGAKPDIASELGWDPAFILVQALRSLGPDAAPAAIRDHIGKLQNYAGVNGVYDFVKVPQRGLDVSDAVVTRWSPEAKTWQVVSKPTGIPLPSAPDTP
ncbi:MAG TPA: ABC transporter substrate-binding protein [Stellaceae bacterium]|nr:ABC transporter substrate-binding protein [Stellaceae bacterium]